MIDVASTTITCHESQTEWLTKTVHFNRDDIPGGARVGYGEHDDDVLVWWNYGMVTVDPLTFDVLLYECYNLSFEGQYTWEAMM